MWTEKRHYADECLLLGVKRTWPIAVQMSAFDPKRTCQCQRSIPGALRGIRMVRGSTFLIPTDHMETLVATNLSLNSSVRLWPLAEVPIPAFGLQADRNVSCSFGDCLRFLFTAAIP